MKKLYQGIVIALLCLPCTLLAQRNAIIKGTILDGTDRSPLIYATIALLNGSDTSLIAYTLSDKNGQFALHNVPAGTRLRLAVSYIGHQSMVQELQLKPSEVMQLPPTIMQSQLMKEIVIKEEQVPVRIKKDTIEFDAAMFKVQPNAVLEELLKRLPGLQVNLDGSMTFNGRTVTKIKIDGKEFFGTDPRVALKNLDADLIKKIQLYDDRENDPDHLIAASKVNKIINVKLKSALRKSMFGKVYAGAGTDHRYESGGLLNLFRDTLQISLVGLSNNLTESGFSSLDLYDLGGFGRGGGDALPGLSLGNQSRNYIQQVSSAGVNINTDYGRKLKINMLYFYGSTQNRYHTNSTQEQFLSDTTLHTNSVYQQVLTINKHNFSGLVEWNPDTATQIHYTPSASLVDNTALSTTTSDRSDNFTPRINSSSTHINNKTPQNQFQQSFYYYHKFRRKGASFTIAHNLTINPYQGEMYTDNILSTYAPSAAISTLNNYVHTQTNLVSGNLSFNYRLPLSKTLTANANLQTSYDNTDQMASTFNKDSVNQAYDLPVPEQSVDLHRKMYSQTLKTDLTERWKSTDIIVGLTTLQQRIFNHFSKIDGMDQTYTYLLPYIKINGPKMAFSYDISINQPRINDLQPVTIDYNILYAYTGNPELVPSKSHNFGLSYNNYLPERMISLNAYLNTSIIQNGITVKSEINSTGDQQAMPVNVNGQYNLSAGGYFAKQFKPTPKFRFNFNDRLNMTDYRSIFAINGSTGWQSNYTVNFVHQFTFSYLNKIDFSPAYGITYLYTAYQRDYNNQNSNFQTVNAQLVIRWPKKIIFQTNYGYTYNSQITAGYQKSINLLNTSIALLMFKKDKGQLKLSVYDLLNQNVSVFRYAVNNTITETQNQILRRYFLLTYQYKFSKTSTK